MRREHLTRPLNFARLAATLALAAGLLTACFPAGPAEDPGPGARFPSFEYVGDDEIFTTALADDEFRNPILAGYYPDPSVVQVDSDYYLVNSTFGFFPGLPVFHSRDLVNWTQISNAVHRADQMSFEGMDLGLNGLYAPAIEYRDGTFYVINTCIGCGGNFIVNSTDPAGPWSDPIWLPHLGGIDPSLFFDDDGKTYIVHHDNPVEPLYAGHTEISVMEVDPVTFEPLSDDVLLVDGADEAPWPTEWIEGPHLYKVDGRYYLSAAGGGTGYRHGQLVYRSDTVFGPYEPNPENPVLTQLGLPDDREDPVTATGHGDFFQDAQGDWWIVFLGTRVYDLDPEHPDPGHFHTGRETFMLPVTWENGWPRVLKEKPVPYVVKRPDHPAGPPAARAMTGNFSVTETFREPELGLHWLFIRTPTSRWWRTGDGELVLEPRAERIGDGAQPSFVGRRLAHMKASVGTTLRFNPQSEGAEAGLLALQNDRFYYAFGLGLDADGDTVLRVRKRAGADDPARGHVLAEEKIDAPTGAPIHLRLEIDRPRLDFGYSLDGEVYETLLDDADAGPLTTAVAGGFTGAVVGMYAEGPPPGDGIHDP
ncbi:MAG: glycoside hydrolase family 43 protein [Acidobacteriota bacterium]